MKRAIPVALCVLLGAIGAASANENGDDLAVSMLATSGYRDYRDLQRFGDQYLATVIRNGRTVHLLVDPEAQRIEVTD